jgi:hypothetical protein
LSLQELHLDNEVQYIRADEIAHILREKPFIVTTFGIKKIAEGLDGVNDDDPDAEDQFDDLDADDAFHDQKVGPTVLVDL